MIRVQCRGLDLPEVPFYVGAYYVDPNTREVYLGVEMQTKDQMLFTLVSLHTGWSRMEPRVLGNLTELTKGLMLYHHPEDPEGLVITLVK